tara:strand:- start:411 stop:614 length:204 start_codon:yes stop_codon:yes gene_type:complete
MSQREIDELAIQWNNTKDPKYKKLWYKKVREAANGIDRTQRWRLSISSCNKANDGTYVLIGKRIRSV